MPDGTPADIGNPQWSFADLSQKMSQYAAIQTGEAMLNQHLNDAHDYLGTDEKDIPKLKDLRRKCVPIRTCAKRFRLQPLWWHRAH